MLFKNLALGALCAASGALASGSNGTSLPAIEVAGNKFFYSNNGSQFYIKGVAYQSDTANSSSGDEIQDPLADYSTCSRDIPYLKKLGTNVVRVYAVNNTLDHSKCMEALADNDIYVVADLSIPGKSVDRTNPKWNVELYERYVGVVDSFANYTNVLGFFAGNEVTNNASNTEASTFVKAAVRDVKKYMKKQNYRSIPVGYSSNDDEDTRVPMADYFACGDEDVKVDFYGINMYEWCGDSSFQTSGYKDRTQDFKNISVPIFFSEYGCVAEKPRKFTEVQALYGDDMTDVWSGGIVYMYFQEENDYGLVSIDDNKVKTLSDYENLSSQLAKISPSAATNSSYTAKSTSLSCPATQKYWQANTKLPPTPSRDMCGCMADSLECVVNTEKADEDHYGKLFSWICENVDCKGITANATSGEYGSYSFCSPAEQLSFVMNLYYEKNGKKSSACQFSGSGTLQKAQTKSACSGVLSQIGSSGTGSASSTVSGVYKSGSASDSGSSSGDQSSSSKSSSTNSVSEGKKNLAVGSKASLSQVILSFVATLGVVAGAGFAMA